MTSLSSTVFPFRIAQTLIMYAAVCRRSRSRARRRLQFPAVGRGRCVRSESLQSEGASFAARRCRRAATSAEPERSAPAAGLSSTSPAARRQTARLCHARKAGRRVQYRALSQFRCTVPPPGRSPHGARPPNRHRASIFRAAPETPPPAARRSLSEGMQASICKASVYRVIEPRLAKPPKARRGPSEDRQNDRGKSQPERRDRLESGWRIDQAEGNRQGPSRWPRCTAPLRGPASAAAAAACELLKRRLQWVI